MSSLGVYSDKQTGVVYYQTELWENYTNLFDSQTSNIALVWIKGYQPIFRPLRKLHRIRINS